MGSIESIILAILEVQVVQNGVRLGISDLQRLRLGDRLSIAVLETLSTPLTGIRLESSGSYNDTSWGGSTTKLSGFSIVAASTS